MRIKISLVQPPYKSRVVRVRNNILPPLGLGYIAGTLRAHGFDVEIIDGLAKNLSIQDICRRLEKRQPHLIGITALVPSSNSALEIGKAVKSLLPKSVVIAGGPYFGIIGGNALEKHNFLDLICAGEGEETMLELACFLSRCEQEDTANFLLENMDDLLQIKGLYIRRANSVIFSGQRPLIDELDNYAVAWDLLPTELYTERGIRQIVMVSSRGCVQKCNFCTQWLFWRKWRTRSPKNIVDEMELLVNQYDFQSIRFGDEEFLADKSRVEAICDEILKRGLKVAWACQGSVELIIGCQNILPKIRKSGLELMFTGVESPYKVEEMGKRLRIDKVKIAIGALRANDILSLASFIIGTPSDTEQDINNLISFAINVEPDVAVFNIFTPLPGTSSYKEADESALIEIRDYSMYDYSNPVARTNFLTSNDITRLFVKAYRRFYGRPEKIGAFMNRSRSETGTILSIVGNQSTAQPAFLEKINRMLALENTVGRS